MEGAGGVMVPLNDYYHMASLMDDLHLPVILVSRNYLGSINHTFTEWKFLRYMIFRLQVSSSTANGIILPNRILKNTPDRRYWLVFPGGPMG